MTEHQLRTCSKNMKSPESRKAVSGSYNSGNKKQSRKGENPVRFASASEQSSSFRSSTWICKNSACRAVISLDDAFCKRCSCCICHQFDDNKDPSLWLVCESESGRGDSCGLSCHIECAFQQEKVGVVNLGQFMQLDGSYCCASCGKVSGILGCWKKQLIVAKDARRVDMLCYRIFLSYRLLDGTSRFKELHEIVTEAKIKLEEELGPMNGDSVKMARGIVSRLSISSDVQKLCCHAIDKGNEWLANVSAGGSNSTVDSLPAACRFLFEEVTSSSLVIVLIELFTPLTDHIKGYKLWFCKSRSESFSKEPVSIFSRENGRILIKKLQPCTEYTFRIVSYTETGDLGHSEAKCFTKSVEIINKSCSAVVPKTEKPVGVCSSNAEDQLSSNPTGSSSGFKVRELGKILHLAWAQEQGSLEGFCSADVEQCCGVIKHESPKDHQSPPVSRELDLNVVSVPDLNEDLTPPLEYSRDEDNVCTLERATGPDDDAASHSIQKNGLVRLNGGGPSEDLPVWALTQNGDVPAVNSSVENRRKRASSTNEETHDCDSTLINGSPFYVSGGPGSLDGNFEYCVKVIRWLECEGHIKQEFRLKLLTWFSLRSTEQERRVVNTYIQTLIDDPKSLAGQLADSFGDIISCKRQRSSFTSFPP